MDFFNHLPSELGTQVRERYNLSPPSSPQSAVEQLEESPVPEADDPARHLERERRRLSLLIGPREPGGKPKGAGRNVETERKLSVDQELAIQNPAKTPEASSETMTVD